MKSKLNEKTAKIIFFAVAVVMMVLMIWFGVSTDIDFGRNPLPDVTFPRGRVIEVISDQTAIDEGGLLRGQQWFLVEILTGEHRGDIVQVSNIMFIDAPVNPQVGTVIILSFEYDEYHESYNARVHSYERETAIYITILLFFGLIALIGGKAGLSSVFGLIFTFVTLLFLLVPAIIRGASPAIMTIALSIMIIAVSLITVMGFKKKTWASIFGTSIAIAFYCLFYFVIAAALRISGFSIPEMSQLMAIGFTDTLKISELLFCGILIASLGAVMDTSVSVASATAELSATGSSHGFKPLLKSSMRVVRDCVGSSANTLILAFTGTFFISLILFRIHELNYTMLINRVDIAIEVLRAVSASAGMILSAPATAVIASHMYCVHSQKQDKINKSKQKA